ncbi:unnamed protein product [Anisakis simplex]|uniref:Uncharacterized protein n=1 Tax=Anisakis simplex TaxID=6269 RepID=A0A0M3K7V9_ANISI|nr:unnamed protein product [Anisakis simplex]
MSDNPLYSWVGRRIRLEVPEVGTSDSREWSREIPRSRKFSRSVTLEPPRILLMCKVFIGDKRKRAETLFAAVFMLCGRCKGTTTNAQLNRNVPSEFVRIAD